jgi:hypothetical protein
MRIDTILGGFRKRNLPINADYRPMYKIGLIICILNKVCIGNKASLNKLHFFIWALKSARNREFIQSLLDSGNTEGLISWGVEPALNKALSLCLAEELVAYSDDKYILTDKGAAFTMKIEKDNDLFVEEKEFLNNIGKRKVTEAFINQLTLKITH